jgi:hypothetical protein
VHSIVYTRKVHELTGDDSFEDNFTAETCQTVFCNKLESEASKNLLRHWVESAQREFVYIEV